MKFFLTYGDLEADKHVGNIHESNLDKTSDYDKEDEVWSGLILRRVLESRGAGEAR